MERLLHFLFNHCRLIATIARVAQHRYRKGRPPQRIAAWQTVLYGLLITTAPRAIFFGQALKESDTKWAQEWEPIMWLAAQNFPILNGNFILCMAALPLFSAYCHYLFDFRVHLIDATPLVSDLFVVNCRRLLVNNAFLVPYFGKTRLLELARASITYYGDIWRGSYDQSFRFEALALPYFPGLSKRVRVKAAIVALNLEYATLAAVAGICKPKKSDFLFCFQKH